MEAAAQKHNDEVGALQRELGATIAQQEDNAKKVFDGRIHV
jgi:hypothetical protein